MTLVGFKDHFAETITVEHPREATHNCPTMVSEGSSVTCRCNSSKAGNPPATTVWDGVKNETLHIENIHRQTKTNVYTCRVVWGSDGWINRSTLHTFDVAYGPSSVRIDNITDETGKEIDMLRLMCTAVDVHPSAIFRWNITCDNQTHNSNTSTCALSTANVSQGTVVTCIASNNFSSDMSSYSSFVFDHTGSEKSLPNDQSIIIIIVPLILLVTGIIITVVATIVYRRKGSRGGNAQNETANGNEGERTSKKSDSSTSSPGQAAGNGSKSGGSTPRSSSSGSDKPSTNPNYTSTALQEVEIHPYMDLHTRDPTYASTTSSKDPHMYMELKTLKALQPGSEKNGNDGYETPQVPGQANKSSDGYETPQPPREGRRRSTTYANQGVSADPIQEEVNYYNEA